MLQTFGIGKTIVGSEEMTMMHVLLREWCEERGYSETGREATAAARELIDWFQAGATQKWKLHALLKARL